MRRRCASKRHRFARRANLPRPQLLISPPNQYHYWRRPVPRRGALRDRHGRWVRDAMDATRNETKDVIADGEVVWS
jgi:hypothetical protein